MDQEDIKSLFEDKYQRLLGISYADWLEKGPQTEDQAYARCAEIDKELNRTYDDWFNSTGDEKMKLEDYRDKLKSEYDLIETTFGLDFEDRNW
jgi:hypothetical protein